MKRSPLEGVSIERFKEIFAFLSDKKPIALDDIFRSLLKPTDKAIKAAKRYGLVIDKKGEVKMFGFKYLFNGEGKKKKGVKEMLQKAHKDLDANKLMHEYEKEVFGWWGGDKVKADAMTAEEIQEKWEAHQKKMRDLGVY